MSMTYSPPEWSLGDRMRKSRESARAGDGISRAEMRELLLARGISASASTLSAWETDTSRPGHGKDFLAVVAAWSEITECPEAWILLGAREEFIKRGNRTLSNHTGPGRDSEGRRRPRGAPARHMIDRDADAA